MTALPGPPLVVAGLSVRCRGEALGEFPGERQPEPRWQADPDLHTGPAGTPLGPQDHPLTQRPAGKPGPQCAGGRHAYKRLGPGPPLEPLAGQGQVRER